MNGEINTADCIHSPKHLLFFSESDLTGGKKADPEYTRPLYDSIVWIFETFLVLFRGNTTKKTPRSELQPGNRQKPPQTTVYGQNNELLNLDCSPVNVICALKLEMIDWVSSAYRAPSGAVCITWRSRWSSGSLTPDACITPLSLLSWQTWKHIQQKMTPNLHTIYEDFEISTTIVPESLIY